MPRILNFIFAKVKIYCARGLAFQKDLCLQCAMFSKQGKQMQLPTDMKNYKGSDYDSFSLIPANCAGWALLVVVVLACILEPLFRAG